MKQISSVARKSQDETLQQQKLSFILGLSCLTLAGSLVGPGIAISAFFIVVGTGLAFYLYSKSAAEYISFVFWLWFLAPLFRRFCDYHNGFDAQGIMLLAPYLATFLAAIKLIQNPAKTASAGNSSFLLALAAVIYSFCIGWLNTTPMSVLRASLDWFPPIIFGLYISLNWQLYPKIKVAIQNTFAWGTLLMGAYGIYQYMTAPAWDTFWMTNATIGSVGNPEPFGIRVWSTMNAPGPFASVALAGIILLLSYQPPIFIPSYVAGFLAFMLSGVRAAWLGWALAQLMLISSIKQKLQIRLILIGLALALMLVPLSTIEPFGNVISDRVSSLFGNVQSDSSFQARTATYDANLRIALTSGLGKGLGGTFFVNESGAALKVALDSGVLDLFFTLGWVGALPYLAALLMLFLRQFFTQESRFDVFISATRAISAANIFQMLFGNTVTGIGGIILWSFLGVNLAAQRYYAHQRQLARQAAPIQTVSLNPFGVAS